MQALPVTSPTGNKPRTAERQSDDRKPDEAASAQESPQPQPLAIDTPQPLDLKPAPSPFAALQAQVVSAATPVDHGASKSVTPPVAAVDTTATNFVPAPHQPVPAATTPTIKPEHASPLVTANTMATVTTRIARAVQDGAHVVTLELHPAELGRVEVRLSFHEGAVGVQMTLDRPATYDAFQRDRSVMEQHLADAGINLASGGLDLRFGQQSDWTAPQPFTHTMQTPLPQDDTGPHSQSLAQSSSDGLIDILA